MNRRAIRTTIERALREWRPILGLATWGIETVWEPVAGEDARTAQIEVRPQYLEATVFFDLARYVSLGYHRRKIEYEVVHELCHCLVGQLARLAEQRAVNDRVGDANETATCMIARALWVAKYGEEPPA